VSAEDQLALIPGRPGSAARGVDDLEEQVGLLQVQPGVGGAVHMPPRPVSLVP
jgi:hypothetical protein